MILLVVSLICSLLFSNIAWFFSHNSEMYNYGGIVGLLFPSMVILERVYKNLKTK